MALEQHTSFSADSGSLWRTLSLLCGQGKDEFAFRLSQENSNEGSGCTQMVWAIGQDSRTQKTECLIRNLDS